MITARKVKSYFRAEGANEYSAAAPTGVASDEIMVVDRLRMALANVKAGNASDEFARRAMEELERVTDGPETARMLMGRA